MTPEFGQVYWIPNLTHNDPNVSQHWVVLLLADKNANTIYYQTLGSRMFEIFPNFGSFRNEHCYNCSSHRHLKEFLRYKKIPNLTLDIDVVEILNYKKYNFLFRETFLSMKKVIKNDNYFDFESKVDKGIYKDCGSLLNTNKTGILFAMRNSIGLSPYEQNRILTFYRETSSI